MKLHHRIIGTGKSIIILHGLFGSSDNWQTFAKALAGAGYEVMLVDLRNHGLSPHADEFNFTIMASDVKELMDSENFDQTILMGHSLGGKVAMKFAELYSEKISKLIVVDIAPRFYEVHHRQILDTLLQVDTTQSTTRPAVEEILKSGIEDFATRQFLMKNLYWKEKDRLDWRFNLKVINEKIGAVGEEISYTFPFTKPTMFVKGEKSNYISTKDETAIMKMYSNVQIKTAPGSGHWVHADNAEWLLSTVLEFVTINS